MLKVFQLLTPSCWKRNRRQTSVFECKASPNKYNSIWVIFLQNFLTINITSVNTTRFHKWLITWRGRIALSEMVFNGKSIIIILGPISPIVINISPPLFSNERAENGLELLTKTKLSWCKKKPVRRQKIRKPSINSHRRTAKGIFQILKHRWKIHCRFSVLAIWKSHRNRLIISIWNNIFRLPSYLLFCSSYHSIQWEEKHCDFLFLTSSILIFSLIIMSIRPFCQCSKLAFTLLFTKLWVKALCCSKPFRSTAISFNTELEHSKEMSS